MVAALAMATITVAPSISVPQEMSPPLCRQGWKTPGSWQGKNKVLSAQEEPSESTRGLPRREHLHLG